VIEAMAWIGAMGILMAAGVTAGGEGTRETLQRMLPGARELRPDSIALTDAERRAFRERTGMSAPAAATVIYSALSDTGLIGYVVLDEVRGKDQPITYAVAVGPDLAIRSLEILDYREAYGGEVRNGSWRNQFLGKTPAEPLRPGREISAITGATISSRAVTLGVRRVLVTLDLIRGRLPR
jgi:Na+-translocating ferredoxin:NAD+ oxidoreductase RnfG subunit